MLLQKGTHRVYKVVKIIGLNTGTRILNLNDSHVRDYLLECFGVLKAEDRIPRFITNHQQRRTGKIGKQ